MIITLWNSVISQCEDQKSLMGFSQFPECLRVIVSKNQRNGGNGQKIDFAHTLSV